jgi:hypothetical protein
VLCPDAGRYRPSAASIARRVYTIAIWPR